MKERFNGLLLIGSLVLVLCFNVSAFSDTFAVLDSGLDGGPDAGDTDSETATDTEIDTDTTTDLDTDECTDSDADCAFQSDDDDGCDCSALGRTSTRFSLIEFSLAFF
ncbi:MAG: hypothetical protein QNJ97_01985 [Myxococcota bacterium]|nr:hypothetical protein [Myxococcota bacterium]